MIENEEVIKYFNARSENWNDEIVINDKKINKILDNAHISENMKILDVACGTGVLIPYYLERNVQSVLGVDISPGMIEIARRSFNDSRISFYVGDAEKSPIESDYDGIVIYNAFPHFKDGERIIQYLSEHLKDGGYLTVAHGMSREQTDAHHKGSAKHISNGLMEIDELSKIFSKYLTVTASISDSEIYQIVGKKIR